MKQRGQGAPEFSGIDNDLQVVSEDCRNAPLSHTRARTAVLASFPPPATLVLMVRRNSSCGVWASAAVVSVTAIDFKQLTRIVFPQGKELGTPFSLTSFVKQSFSLRTALKNRCSSTESP